MSRWGWGWNSITFVCVFAFLITREGMIGSLDRLIDFIFYTYTHVHNSCEVFEWMSGNVRANPSSFATSRKRHNPPPICPQPPPTSPRQTLRAPLMHVYSPASPASLLPKQSVRRRAEPSSPIRLSRCILGGTNLP